MHFEAKANFQDRAGTVFHIENEPLLIERLLAFGLIETSTGGGWRLTECCHTGLAAIDSETQAAPPAGPAVVIRQWRPRTI